VMSRLPASSPRRDGPLPTPASDRARRLPGGHRRRLADWLTRASLTLYAMPSFWLGLVLAWLFGIRLQLLPVAQRHDPLLDPDASWLARTGDVLRHLILPAVTLTAVSLAAVMRYQRGAPQMLDLISCRRRRAQLSSAGALAPRTANALFPVIRLLGLWLPILVSGSVFVRQVSAGAGSLAADAVGAATTPSSSEPPCWCHAGLPADCGRPGLLRPRPTGARATGSLWRLLLRA
jgi:peptide/nickel transport system permease protein